MSVKKDILEKLAEIEHDQWIAWSQSIAETEVLSPKRPRRWRTLWVPYKMLTESQKDSDREWAQKVLEVIRQNDNN